MLRYICFLLTIFYFFYANTTNALQSNWSGIDEAKVRIISPLSKTGAHHNIYLGLEYQLQEGWKTYWSSPGEGGYPQTLDWKNSTNVSSLEILWPQPKEFYILGLKSIGYENEVIFPLKVELENIHRSSFFSFDLNYLTCREICIPGKAHLELILPSGQGKLTGHSFQIEKYLSKIPHQNGDIIGLKILNVTASSDTDISLISIEAQSQSPLIDPKFFLGNDLGLPITAPQYNFSADRKHVTAQFFYDDSVFDDNFNLSVLLSDRNVALEYKTSVEPIIVSRLFAVNHSYIYIFLIAILGGLILNVMPCVLPVLSLKLLSILNHRQHTFFYSIRKSFFVTASGIIISFLLLSFALIGLKLSGTSIGWGMQFQQPLFLMIISLVLFLFSLNLMGFFEFHLPHFMSNSLSKPVDSKSFYTDFFNGFFVTLLATPCSAPFVGTAVSVAFTQSSFIMVGIFFFMGLGMASPYIIVGLFPKTVSLLPKPGTWMKTIKYFLAIFLLGTLGWIGMILQNHFSNLFIIISLFLALTILVSFRYLSQLKFSAIIVFIIIFFSLNFFPQLKIDKLIDDTVWQDLTKVNIDELINHNIIFVDVTADWCATCQFNKFNVLNSKLVQNAFIENNVIKVRGDWTKPSKQIEEYLNSYNRFGIPFNILYNKNYPKGIILSELLSTSKIINMIAKLNNAYK
ncbi:MAG: Thiol:disulfide interchange protein DsbD [Alphaproteobacteria bacterium MarineAlpha6_Bin2]|nr:MAG: Thiol:disulfide interchange protein DsbD [Alphaproteobacteria bacterium MarineAlpha6_Bin2]